jgi:hypothetical protein
MKTSTLARLDTSLRKRFGVAGSEAAATTREGN